MTTLADRIGPAALGKLAQLRADLEQEPPPAAPARFKVSRIGERVAVVHETGGLVVDVDPASARTLAGQLAAAGEER